MKKREDGIVIIDPVKAKGRKDLVERLPLRPHLVERGASGAADLDVYAGCSKAQGPISSFPA